VAKLSEIIKTLKTNKNRLSQKNGLSLMAVFGSYGRGQENEESDLDILVDFYKPIGIEFVDLANELEDLLNMKIDLVSKGGVKPEYYKQIESELTYV
jgi:uncharacterized protein